VAMSTLAVGCVVDGFVQVPHVTTLIDKFLEPTFADSTLVEQLHHPSDSLLVVGLVLSAVLGLAGIALAYRIWVKRPGIATSLRERLAPAYRISLNKWYWDELLDTLFVRPAAWSGRFAQQTFERVVVDGLLVGGATSVVRAGSAAVRGMQSGFLRYYAALLVAGVAAVGLYFLLASS
jgi:NADH-quinone oxidoreductase subunit L